jgi:ferrous iron transport protein B
MFSIYVLGVAVAILCAKLLRSTLFRGETSPFIMELPPYRVPTFRSVCIHMWRRAWMYLKKAGTIILAISIVIWALTRFPLQRDLQHRYETRIAAAAEPARKASLRAEFAEKRLEQSYAGRLGRGAAWALRPAGLGHWKIGTALIAGFGAKEVIVATFGTLYSVEEEVEEEGSPALRERLRADPRFSPLTAYSLMVFVLLYVPCVATVAVVRNETRSWRWAAFLVFYTTAVAWIMSTLVYQGGRLLGLG